MLLIARHGETEWNVKGRKQGRADSPLTRRGVAQARDIAALVASIGIDRLYTSPLGRARRTAAIIAEATGRTPEVDRRLAECDYGACQGLTAAEIEERFPGLIARRDADKWSVPWPLGESYANLWRRAAAFATDVLHGGDEQAAGRVCIVAHEAFNRTLVGYHMGLTRQQFLDLEQPHRVVFRCDGGAFTRLEPLTAGEPR